VNLPKVFVLLCVMIDAMGVGLIIPVMPDLIRDVNGGSLAQAALWGGVLSTVYAVMQFLCAPMVGNLSDRYGRRPVLLISLAVMAVNYIVMALAGSIWLLLAGRVIGGVTSATASTASAWMADTSKPHEKAANFGLIGAAFGMGFVLGPIVGGLLGTFGPRAPFYAAAVLATLNFALGYFVLRETVTDAIRRPFEWRRANPFGAFRVLGKLPGLRRLMVVFFLAEVAFFVYPAIWAYYTQASFGWSPATIGLSLALFGIGIAVVQGGLIRVALRYLGVRGTVIYGLSFDVVAFLALGLVTSGAVALILIPLAALAAVVNPALKSIMSGLVNDNAQGELQGALVSVAALAMIVSPMLMTSVFFAFTATGAPVFLPGAPFLVAMALICVALVVFVGPRKAAFP